MDAVLKVEVLRAACCVAGGDGEVSAEERAVLEGLASEVGVGKASLDAMTNRAASDEEFYKEQFRVLKSDPKETLTLLFQVAVADRKLERSECEVLKRLAERLGVDETQFDQWLAEAVETVRSRQS